MTIAAQQYQITPINKLKPSPFPVQAERRARYDATALDDLAKNIAEVGLLLPIVARHVDGDLEIVAGERRWLACQRAQLQEVPVIIRELTDQQALELQLVENLQREGLHELVEAEGYEALMRRHGYSIEDLVAKVGKSRSYVYARIKLLALCADARDAFFAGVINASIALLLARLPTEKLQREALAHVGDRARPMTTREAAHFIQSRYTLALSEAPWGLADADLVPCAGACTTCPKRTGNQRELFADIESDDVCTDPDCFESKRKAHVEQLLTRASAEGKKVISGAAAQKLIAFENGDYIHLSGKSPYVELNRPCYDDPKNRTYQELIEAAGISDIETALIHAPGGAVVEVVDRNKAMKRIKAAGVINPPAPATKQGPAAKLRPSEWEVKQETREELFLRLLTAVRAKDGRELGKEPLAHLIEFSINGQPTGDIRLAKEVLGIKDYRSFAPPRTNIKLLTKLSTADLRKAAIDAAYLADFFDGDDDGKDLLTLTAKRLKINVTKLRQQVETEIRNKYNADATTEQRKTKAKKKAAGKSK